MPIKEQKATSGRAAVINGIAIDPAGATTGQTLVYDGVSSFVPGAGGGGGGDMLLAGVQTNTGAKTFNSGTLITGTINTPTASDLVINLGTQGGNGALIVFKLNNTEEMRFKMSGGLSIGVAADNTSRGVLMANGGTISTIAVNATQQAMLYSSSDDITIKSLSQNGTLTAIFGGSAKFSMLDSTFTERFAVSTVQLKTTGLYQDMGSIADPGNCGGSQGRTYWKLNGGGKMEFKAIGPSGAASVLFTEP